MIALLDQAIRLLDQVGFIPEDEEVFDLLTTANALRRREGERALLRPAFLHRLLGDLPAAFSLFNRDGAKVGTLSGGEVPHGDALLATTPARGELSRSAWSEITEASCAAIGFDVIGSPPAAADLPRPLGDLFAICVGTLRSGRPQLVRLGDPESIDGVRAYLSALRGSPREAELKPHLIVEAQADALLHWPPLACRILIDGARQGVPIAVVGPVPSEPVAAVATLLAGVLIGQLARRQSPVLWGIPLHAAPGWRHCHAVGRQLHLPQLSMRMQRAGSPLHALQAMISGATLVAWSGALNASAADLLRDAAEAPEIWRCARLLAAPESSADPRVVSVQDVETRLARQAPQPADSALRHQLTALLQREAQRTEASEALKLWEACL